jgi:hypothetical protein
MNSSVLYSFDIHDAIDSPVRYYMISTLEEGSRFSRMHDRIEWPGDYPGI